MPRGSEAGHRLLVQSSVRPAGPADHRAQLVYQENYRVLDTLDAAYAKEIQLHAYFDVKTHPFFFNRANQTTQKFPRTNKSRAQQGRVYSPETKAKIAAAQRVRHQQRRARALAMEGPAGSLR